MTRKIGVTIALAILLYWVVSGDARRALERAHVIPLHQTSCVYAREGWSLGEHKKCQRLNDSLVCSDYESNGHCHTLDIAYDGDMEAYLENNPNASPDWDCQLKNDTSNGINSLECRISKETSSR